MNFNTRYLRSAAFIFKLLSAVALIHGAVRIILLVFPSAAFQLFESFPFPLSEGAYLDLGVAQNTSQGVAAIGVNARPILAMMNMLSSLLSVFAFFTIGVCLSVLADLAGRDQS